MRCADGMWYVHRSDAKRLLLSLSRGMRAQVEGVLAYAEEHGIPYEVVRLDTKGWTLALIESPDWDEAYEPSVGTVRVWSVKGQLRVGEPAKISKRKSLNGAIFLSKEQLVASDYSGFDVAAAAERTRIISALPDPPRGARRCRATWAEYLRANGVECDEEARA